MIQEQIGGNHYEGMSIQPWDFFTANATPDEIRGACKKDIIKYLRNKKDVVEDLKKSRWYLNELIKLEESLRDEKVELTDLCKNESVYI